MSDRSAFTLIVYDCPPEQRAAVLEIINENGLSEDYGFGPEPTNVELGVRYGADEMMVGSYDTVGVELENRAPEATFMVWNDPKYEYPGGLVMYAPLLGRFDGDCDADGNVYFTGKQIKTLVDKHGVTDALWRAVGLPWLDRIEELPKASGKEQPVG